MSLLDGGLQAVFGAALSSLYLDATLHKRVETHATNGDISIAETDHPVKAQKNRATRAMMASPGFVETDVAIFVLQSGAPAIPTADDEITYQGVRYSIASVSTDPANAYWLLRGQVA